MHRWTRQKHDVGTVRVPLTPAQWERVATEFDRLVEASADTRQAAVAALAAEHAESASELEGLLRAADRTDSRLDGQAFEALAAPRVASPALLGRRVGAYEVTQVIGRGGMGVVFEGQHTDPLFAKRVAIKTLSIGVDNPERLWRFRRERQILATLDHPNIAALYDGGTTDDGIPYIVMEYVSGVRIDEWCDTRRLTIAQRLDLFRQVCSAVHFAHTKLVVHRDLKPNNILVTDTGVVKLLDFGIAKLLTPDDEPGDSTRGGFAPLTAAYASPEQAQGDSITTATDVYSLGVMLYRILTGGSPYDLEGQTPADIRRILSTQEPRLPSDAVTDEQAHYCGAPDRRALSASLRGELDAVVQMALRKDAVRRYASVEALSSDLLRHLKGQTVLARPDTLGYRVRTFVRRQRALVVGASIAMLAMIGGTLVAMRSAATARAEAHRSQQMVGFLKSVVGAADATFYGTIKGSADITLREVLDSTAVAVATSFPADARLRADLYTTLGRSFRRFNRYTTAIALIDSARVLHARTTGPTSLESTEDLLTAAWLMMEVGKNDSAITTLRTALAQYSRLPDAPPPLVTYAMAGLGQLEVLNRSNHAEGIPLLRTAVARERASPSPRVQVLGISEGTLGYALIATGNERAGDSAYARSIAILESDSVRHAEDLAIQLTNWGATLSERARTNDAAAVKRRAVQVMLRSNGPNHLMTAVLQSRLASELVELSRYSEARGLVDSALLVFERLTPRNVGELVTALGLHAAADNGLGEPTRAALTLKRSRALLDSVDGSVARTEDEVSLLLIESGLMTTNGVPRRAYALAVQAETLARRQLGDNDPRTRKAARRVAELSAAARR
jgi:eukaryotic-like serine/threonine-protein kinase